VRQAKRKWHGSGARFSIRSSFFGSVAQVESSALEMTTESDQSDLIREAKAIVVLAFRNGPIEDVHAGKTCPTCNGKTGLSSTISRETPIAGKPNP
jgi:hypothetical protein